MCKSDVVRAWKDEDYRMSLSEAERRMLPTNPAGLIEISDSELGAVGGGNAFPGGGFSAYPAMCSCMGGCETEFFQICSGDWSGCPSLGDLFCPIFPKAD